jgi:hypothetical protein
MAKLSAAKARVEQMRQRGRNAALYRLVTLSDEELSRQGRAAVMTRWAGKTAEERMIEYRKGRRPPKPRCKCGKHTAHFAQLVGLKCRLTAEWGRRLSDY